MKGVCSINRKKLISLLVALPVAIAALLYGGGFLAQFLYNYEAWQAAGGSFGTAPPLPDANFFACIAAVFRWPSGPQGLGLCIAALAALMFGVLHIGQGEGGTLDKARNLTYSDKGTYGTAGFMGRKELKEVLDLVSDVRKHPGIILGELDRQAVCVPLKTRFNGNLAVYGASGSKKTRAFCMNMILQSVARKSSLIICDPKSELYEKSSEYLRDQGYTVKVFNLVTPSASDSWNCLSEIEGQELMAQLFCDVIIKNTGSGRGDHFWDNAEMNLLKALVLYVEQGYSEGNRTIGEVYRLLSMTSEKELDSLFDGLPVTHPAKAPNAAKAWGLNVEGCKANEPQRILDALSQGKLVVALMSKGHFTTTGHFIVLRGVQDGKILVADPASTSRSQKAWDLSIILNEAGHRAGAGGPFWLIGPG